MVLSFAIASALSLGVADYLAGVTLRRDGRTSSALTYTAISTLLGLLIIALAVPFAVPEEFSRNDVLWSIAAGCAVGVALPLLMIGMGKGPISVVAPVLGIVSLAVPAILGPLLGDELSRLELLGLLAAFPAAVMVAASSKSSDGEFSTLQAVGIAALAGVMFGAVGVCFGQTSPDSGIGPGVVSQVVAAVFLVVVAAASGNLVRPKRAAIWPDLGAGVLSAGALVLSLFAFQRGPVALVAAVIALAPGPTVLLAWRLTHERISRIQIVGFGFSIASVVLFAVG